MSDSLDVAVAMPVRRAERTIRATIDSLLAQCRGLSCQIVVAVSAEDPTRELLHNFSSPNLRIITAPGKWGVPQLRRDAVSATEADLVVIVEDNCLFPDGWLSGLVECSRRSGASVCGGPVRNGRRTLVGWAQYFTRYTTFLPPMAEGETPGLPGNNAIYTRAILRENADLLQEGFWEAEFNRELIRRGHRLWMCPDLAVEQRQHRGAFEYIPLRYRHGRCYGARRVRVASPELLRKLWTRAPLIPAVLFGRSVRAVLRRRSHRMLFAIVSPLVLIHILAWAAGEIVGYALGAGCSCVETD